MNTRFLRAMSFLLVLCLLSICGYAEANSEYVAELQLLNEYMRVAGENAPVGIDEIYDQIEGNGRIGEYTVEFGIYANVLRLLEAEDYSAALKDVGDLRNGGSFEKFRAYLEDGEELRAWGLYALDSVERLYSYVQGRASEARGEWKKAAQYYSTCEQFMDARDRKQFANQVTPLPTPTPKPTPKPTPEPTPTPIQAPKLISEGLYRLFPEIKLDTNTDDVKSILKDIYGFDEVEIDVEDNGFRCEVGKGKYLGIPISFGTIDRSLFSSGNVYKDDTVFFEDDETGFNMMLGVLNCIIGKPDFGTVELYEFGDSEFEAGRGRHELRHLTADELREGTFSSIISSSRLTSAKEVKIQIYWGNLWLFIDRDKQGWFSSWLDAESDLFSDNERDIFEGPETVNKDYLPADWSNNRKAVARGWENDVSLVQRIQQALNAAGYSAGKVDGSFGQKSEKAISAWQKDHMINGSSGICTPLTAIRLLSDKAEEYRGPAAAGRKMIVVANKKAIYTERGDGSITAYVDIRNTTEYSVVAFCLQFCLLDANGKNLGAAGSWWYNTQEYFIERNDTPSIRLDIDNAKNAKFLEIHIAEVQFVDGTIVSDFITGDLLKSGKTMTLDLEPA